MIVTLTRKGQITIPLSLRKRLNLKTDDQLEFDETAPVLIARRIVHPSQWENTLKKWQSSARAALQDHPWEHQSSVTILDDLRGGPAEKPMNQP